MRIVLWLFFALAVEIVATLPVLVVQVLIPLRIQAPTILGLIPHIASLLLAFMLLLLLLLRGGGWWRVKAMHMHVLLLQLPQHAISNMLALIIAIYPHTCLRYTTFAFFLSCLLLFVSGIGLLVHNLPNNSHYIMKQQSPQSSHRVAVITGANSGIGSAVLEELFRRGWSVLFGARSDEKNHNMAEQIKEKHKGDNQQYKQRVLLHHRLDLACKESIAAFAAWVKHALAAKLGHEACIDVLINNAAILGSDSLKLIGSGIEETLYVNHFGHFYLTHLLLPLFHQSHNPMIINVSSDMSYKMKKQRGDQKLGAGQYSEQGMWDFGCQHKKYDTFEQYSISKLFNIMFTMELKELVGQHSILKQPIVTVAIHPGFVDTSFGSHSPLVQDIKKQYGHLMISKQAGAQGILALCLTNPNPSLAGKYLNAKAEPQDINEVAASQEGRRRLWEIGQKQFAIKFGQ